MRPFAFCTAITAVTSKCTLHPLSDDVTLDGTIQQQLPQPRRTFQVRRRRQDPSPRPPRPLRGAANTPFEEQRRQQTNLDINFANLDEALGNDDP